MSKFSNTIEYNIKTNLDSSGLLRLQQSLNQVNSEMAKMAQKGLVTPEATTKAIANIKQVQIALNKAFDINMNLLDVKKFSDSLSSIEGLSLSGLQKSLEGFPNAQKSLNGMIGTIGQLDTGFKNISSVTDKIMNTFGNTVRWGITASIFQTIQNSLYRSVDYVKDLDTSLNNIQIVTGASAENMRDFSLKANEAAANLGASTVSFTDAAQLYAQNGYSEEDYTKLAELTTKVANVTQQSTSDVSEQITSLMAGYKMSIDEAEDALSGMAVVAAESASDLGELANAEQKVASAANTLGVSQDQLTAQLSTIISVTRQAPEQVGNSLKTIYARLGDLQMGETLEDGVSLGDVSGSLEKVGVAVLDVNGDMRSMGDILEDLMAKWKDLSTAQQQALAVKLAGKYQYNNLMTLMSNSDMYEQQKAMSEGASGALDEQQGIYMESLQAKIQKLQTTWEGFVTELVDSNNFKGAIDGFSALIDGATTLTDTLGGLTPVLTLVSSLMLKSFSGQIAEGLSNMSLNWQRNALRNQNEDEIKRMFGAKADILDGAASAFLQNTVDSRSNLSGKSADIYKTNLQTMVDVDNAVVDAKAQLQTEIEQEKSLTASINETLAKSLKIEGTVGEDLESCSGEVKSLLQKNEAVNQLNADIEQIYAGQKSLLSKDEWWNNLSRDFDGFDEDIEQLREGFKSGAVSIEKVASTLGSISDLTADTVDTKAVATIKTLMAEKSKGNKGLQAAQQGYDQAYATQQDFIGQGKDYAQQLKKQIKTQDIINAASAVGQLAFAWQGFQQLGSLWENTDIDAGDKLLQTISSLALTVPSAYTGFKQLAENLSALSGIKVETFFSSLQKGFQQIEKTKGISDAFGGNSAWQTFKDGIANATSNVEGFAASWKLLTHVLGPAAIAFTALTAAMTIGQARMQDFQQQQEKEQKATNDAAQNLSTISSEVSNFDSLYQSYKQTGQVTDELTESGKQLSQTLGIIGGDALATSGKFDTLSSSISKAKDAAEQKSLNAATAEMNGTLQKSIKGGWFQNGVIKDGSAWSDYNDTVGRITTSSVIAPSQKYATEANSSMSDLIRNATQVQSDLTEQLKDDKLSESEKKSKQDDLAKAQEFLSNGTVTRWLEVAQQMASSQIALSQKNNQGLTGQDLISSYQNDKVVKQYLDSFGDWSDALQFLIDNTTDNAQKLSLQGEQATYKASQLAKAYTNNDGLADQVYSTLEKSGLSDEQKVTLVGQLDKDTTWDNFSKVIEDFKNSPEGQLNLVATIDGTDLENAQGSKSALQSLFDSYTKAYQTQGGFTEDEAAEILAKNPEYIRYLEQVGDLYQLNTEALAEWNQRTREQSDAIDELAGKTMDLSSQSELIGRMIQTYGEGSPYAEALKQVQALNEQMTRGDLSNSDFLDGLTNAFDTLAQKIEEAGGNFETFAKDAQNADFTNLMSDEIYQGMKQTNQQFQAGTINITDYSKTMQNASKQAKRLAIAQGGLSEDQVSAIESAGTLEEATSNVSAAQKKAATSVYNLSKELTALDAAADFNNFVTSNYDDITKIFDDTGTVIKSVENDMGGIQGEYSTTIDGLATSMATYYQNNQEAVQTTAQAISDTGAMTVTAAADMLTNADALAQGMQSNASVASAAMQGTMQSTSAAIGDMSAGITAVIQGVMSTVNSIQGEVNGDVSVGEGSSTSITVDNNTTGEKQTLGTIHIPNFKMKLNGSGKASSSSSGSRGQTRYNATTGQYETEVTRGDDTIVNTPGGDYGVQSTDWEAATSEEIIKYGSDKLASGLGSLLGSGNNSALHMWAPSGKGSTIKPSAYGGSNSKGGSGSGNKGNGSGSGKSYEPKTKDKQEDEYDRYEKVNAHLDRLSKILDRLADAQDRLTGKKLIENMTQQADILEQQVKWQQEKLQLEREEANELQGKLAAYGVQFDTDGYISNYKDVYYDQLNKYNAAINAYNADGTESGQEAQDKVVEQAKKSYDDFKDLIDKYDDLRNSTIEESVKDIEDYYDKIEDLHIEAFKKSVEAVDNMKDMRETLIEFNAIFRSFAHDTDFDEPFNDMQTNAEKLKQYWDMDSDAMNSYYSQLISNNKEALSQQGLSAERKNWLISRNQMYENAKNQLGKGTLEAGGSGYLDMELKNLNDIMEQINQFEKTGASSIFGENSADLYDVAKDIFDSATSMVEDLKSEADDLKSNIIDGIDNIGDAIDKQLDKFDSINDTLEHYADMIEMISGDQAYDKLNSVYEAQIRNGQVELDTLKQSIGVLQDLQKEFEEGSDQWQEVADQISDKQSQVLDKTKDIMDLMNKVYSNNVSKQLDAWTKDTPLGADLDWLSDQWELINRNEDQYLDKTNSAYNIQKLQAKYLDLLDQSDNLLTQQKITDQMNQQLSLLRSKDKLSQYDVDYANAQLEILQKTIALQDAQNNKSQMKLRRDTQGNYSYVYTANEGDVKSAKSDLLDAQNNAYNLSKDNIKQTQDDSLSALQDAKSMISDIWTNANLTLEEKTERTKTIIDSLKQYLAGTADQLSESEQNIIQDFIGMCDMMTDENKAGLDDVYDQLISGNDEAFSQIDSRWGDSISQWLDNLDDFNAKTDETFGSLVDNAKDYADKTKELGDQVGLNFSDMTDAINAAKTATDDLANSTSGFIDKLEASSGVIKNYEKDLQKAKSQVLDLNNAMGEYQSKVNDLEGKLQAEERKNADLSDQLAASEAKYNAAYGKGNGNGNGGAGGVGGSSDDVAYGIAQSIWTYGKSSGWGNNPTRSDKLTSGYGSDFAQKVQDIINQKVWSGSASDLVNYDSMSYSSYNLLGYDTGGYTGTWSETEGLDSDAKNGKLAILHQKELVLNEADTANILKAVEYVREMAQSMSSNGIMADLSERYGAWSAEVSKMQQTLAEKSGNIDQTVNVNAEFPNATSAEEIKTALNDLASAAIQYTGKRIGRYGLN